MSLFTAQINIFNRVSFLEKLLFTKHLAVMMKAGIPISEAISTLLDQTKSKGFKKILSEVVADVKNGQSLTKTFKKHPKVFDEFYISLIEVGEESGALEKNLEFLAKQLAKDYSLRQKIQGAMLYPGIVFFATTVMGGFISFFILPQLVDFFAAFNTTLPITTRILLFFANLMKNYGIIIITGLILSGLTGYWLIGLPKVKPKWHSLMLKFPLFGTLIAYGQLAHFSRNLGVLLSSGVPVIRSLETTSSTLSNLKFRNDLLEVTRALTKGKNIGQALEQKKYNEYPPIVSKMINVGEKTGKLDETLLYLGDFYEDEIDNISKNLSTTLEPILLLIIGLVVGFVAIAIISPIYELTGSIGR